MVGESLIVIVPMKPLAEAKHRLASVLDDSARQGLARNLYVRTLRVLRRVRGVSRVIVVSRDARVLEIARKFGAWSVWENPTGLNESCEQATRVAVANGARAVLIIPSDLARLEAKDVEELIALDSNTGPTIVIVPDRRGTGTNALLVRPAGLIRYSFGEASFEQHLSRARETNAQGIIHQSDGLAFDVDLPEDLETLHLESDARGQHGTRGVVSARQT